MSKYDDFEPTTILDLLKEVDSDFASNGYGADTEIRIVSALNDWGILSVYEDGGCIYLDIEELDNENKN